MLWKGKFVSTLRTKIPNPPVTLRMTPAQTTHFGNLGNFLSALMTVWHSNKIKDYTKFWWLDCIHTNLAVCYTSTLCNLCSEEIHYSHFLADCPFLYTLGRVWKYISPVSDALAAQHAYLLHCSKRLPRDAIFTTAARICSKNCIDKFHKTLIMRKLKKVASIF